MPADTPRNSPGSTPRSTDDILRTVLGNNLQTGALRAILLLAAFSAIGALVAYLLL